MSPLASWLLAAQIAAVSGLTAIPANAAARLPNMLGASLDPSIGSRNRHWSTADIIEVRRITGTAISATTHQVAFTVKQSFVDSDEIRYGLYVADMQGGTAVRLIEAEFLDGLTARPGTDSWTVRGDFGSGIQLYDVGVQGSPRLLAAARPVVVGAEESVIDGDVREGPRATGIASYEWAPDGQSLWYSTYRIRETSEAASSEHGIVYDDKEMYLHSLFNDSTLVLGAELHVLNVESRVSRLVAFVPGGARAGTLFNREYGSASWERDSRHIQYSLWLAKSGAAADFSKWSVDIDSGEARRLKGSTVQELFNAVPAPDGGGYLMVNWTGGGRRLIKVGDDGRVVNDYGPVKFSSVGTGAGLGAWPDLGGRGMILAVRYSDRDGLVTVPASPAGRKMEKSADEFSSCSFSRSAGVGFCARESLERAPELVQISMATGQITPAVLVNPAYAEITPLSIQHAEWVNRYGNRNDGYITYPRGYRRGELYPLVLVTHGHDARNEFANDVFQWEFPIQVLAERGYLVLSVNEPTSTLQSRTAGTARTGVLANQTVEDMQFNEALNSTASMEAALTSAIDSGLAKRDATGIAGYSRGSEIVEWTMTQSKLFHAAIEGDAGGFLAGQYGFSGEAARTYYRQLYGGPPYDPQAIVNERRLSASFRAGEFAGPFLQLFAKTNAVAALELHSLLLDAGIPAELIYYPRESHIFWNPRHRMAAMQVCIDWLDFWLRKSLESDAGQVEEYRRWQAMKSIWERRNGG